jgi:conjugal transfer pilus assembly protein TraB
MEIEKKSEKIAAKQKRLYMLILGGFIGIAGLVVFFMMGADETPIAKEAPQQSQFDTVSKEVKSEDIRLSSLENFSDVLGDRVQSLEKTLLDLNEEKSLVEGEKIALSQETHELREKLKVLEEEIKHKVVSPVNFTPETSLEAMEERVPPLKIWESDEKNENKNVLFEIPAGTVVKAVLVSGADCSVAIQKPTGPNFVLLRPLDDGRLPRKVKVPLKGSIIIGNAIGDISSERVYIRAERMTLVERNGAFVETDVSAYVSGEDGREGMRGVVVDRSGQIITRASFASFLQGIEQTVQATLNNQTIEKLAQTNSDKTILNVDMLRNGAFQGGSTALNKLADYYIKRAEQLQPAIQIEAGRVVEVVFTKTVKIGEQDLKKKFDRERELKARDSQNE